MKKLVLFSLAVISFLFIITYPGCVPSKPGEEAEVLPVERLVKKLEANRRRIKSFEGSGKITISSAQFNNSAQFQVILQKPDSLYFSVMGPFGIELAQVLVTKDNFIFYEALHNTVYKGKISDDVLKGIFKIDLSFQDLTNAFIGSVSLADHLYENPTKFEVLYDNYIMTYADSASNANSIYQINIRDLGLTNYEVSNHRGQASLAAVYSKFKVFESVPIPYAIEVKNIINKQTINIEYKKIEVNKRNTYIQMDIPEDATVIKW